MSLLILSSTNLRKAVRACCTFNPREGYIYRSVTPLDATRVNNRTSFHTATILCTFYKNICNTRFRRICLLHCSASTAQTHDSRTAPNRRQRRRGTRTTRRGTPCLVQQMDYCTRTYASISKIGCVAAASVPISVQEPDIFSYFPLDCRVPLLPKHAHVVIVIGEK